MMELKITSMTPADRLYAYNQSSQLEGQTGCIGHLRGDFGSGQEFYTSWFDHRREYKTDEFTLLFSTARMGVLLSSYSDFFQGISGFFTSLTVNACSVAPSGSSFAKTTSR